MQRALHYKLLILYIILVLTGHGAFCQDTERPLAPVLDLVTVDPLSGFSTLNWTPGGSADVAGYVIYRYSEGEGIAFDTIYNPYATSYTYTVSYANSFIMEYVIAAIDSSNNTSPLSNPLNTVFSECSLDTCRHEIIIEWNPYRSEPHLVTEYKIYSSVNGSEPTEIGSTGNTENSFTFSDFKTSMTYCFTVSALIEGGRISSSNQACIQTFIPRPPAWINGNYASVSENTSKLSFTYDENSEIRDIRIESSPYRDGPFTPVTTLYSSPFTFSYTDENTEAKPLYYRAAAVNSCSEALVYSNLITAMDLVAERVNESLMLRWSAYYQFNGGLNEYRIYRIEKGTENLIATNNPADTVYLDKLSNFAFTANDDHICYYIEAVEGNNPHTSSYLASSDTVCIYLEPLVWMPNAFTPNGDLVNDEFYPHLSFTPVEFYFIITGRSGIRLFETNSYPGIWDGTAGGEKLRPDVYLWFLRVKSPGGRIIEKNGTVTILKN
ncbi:MAG: gliding motility-associated C-terminal domain-containing protein [Marinilabiliaceae bacterium]|nr:gliding motility-associated C-terminal domain-containing protein [Marinilabiliaceae bacterium]